MDFVGVMRLPIEYGSHVFRVGVYVKRTPDKRQYLTMRFLDMQSIKEEKLNKRMERLLNDLIKTGKFAQTSGAQDFIGGYDIQVEGFDGVNDEF